MSVKLLSKHHLEFLSLKGGRTGSSESTLVKCHIVENHVPRLKFIYYVSNDKDIHTDRQTMGGTYIYYRLAPVLVFLFPEQTRK